MLEKALRKRDIDMRMHTTHKPVSGLTLAALYNEEGNKVMGSAGFKIKVIIQGVKALTASFLSCESLFSRWHDFFED